MTVAEVQARVAEVQAQSDKADDERAHVKEDRLFVAVLEAIRDGAPNAAELAREALKTHELPFARWCA